MTVQTLIRPGEYHDSVTLMRLAREIARRPGVVDAAVVMATAANKALLEQGGLLGPEAAEATPNDVLIAVRAEPEAGRAALEQAVLLLAHKEARQEEAAFRPRSVRGGLQLLPEANLAVISVAGRYAAEEAREALEGGLHVLLFSDNVSLEEERALKEEARDRGLLMMGPGAGTALINGVALGFANRVARGPVGIVSAAGTGLQEVATLLDRWGVGVSQGLGTGGRDLKEEIGGIMMLEGVKALQADPGTRILVVISKPPSAAAARAVLEQVERSDKPTVICFLGGEPVGPLGAVTLEQAAALAAREAGADLPPRGEGQAAARVRLEARARALATRLPKGRRSLRGLFSGGTLCAEAQVIWRELLEAPVCSNAPLEERQRMADPTRSQGHVAVDLGEEEFTVGRPHPMIDLDLRLRRIAQEAADPEAAVLVLDVVLGTGAHPDPSSELAPALRAACERGLVVVASVTGTEQDLPPRSRQVALLEAAGALVAESNAEAARLAGLIVKAAEEG